MEGEENTNLKMNKETEQRMNNKQRNGTMAILAKQYILFIQRCTFQRQSSEAMIT